VVKPIVLASSAPPIPFSICVHPCPSVVNPSDFIRVIFA
jgi:hypothetical protein